MSTRSHYVHSRWPSRVESADDAVWREVLDTHQVRESMPPRWPVAVACAADPDLMWPAGEPGSPGYAREVLAARAVCLSCPVLAQCRDWAIAAGEPDGVWGATTPEDRRQWARRAS